MNPVYGLSLHEFSVAQWIERPPDVWEVIGSSPVWDSDFLLCLRLVTRRLCHLHICSPSLKFTIFHSKILLALRRWRRFARRNDPQRRRAWRNGCVCMLLTSRIKRPPDTLSGVLTIYMEKPEIPVGKPNGSRHFVWEALENVSCVLRRCIFFPLFLISSADLDIFCSESCSLHAKFHSFMFPPSWFV